MISRGWTRIRDFGPGMDRIVQGDALNYSAIWYLIDIAERSNKNKILFYHGSRGTRMEFTKTKNGWVADDRRKMKKSQKADLEFHLNKLPNKYKPHKFGPPNGIHGYIIKEENEVVGMITCDNDKITKFGDIWG